MAEIFSIALAGLVAFLFNWLHWRLVRRRNALNSIGRHLDILAKELETNAITYWLSDFKSIPNGQVKQTSLEISIKGSFIRLPKLVTEFTSRASYLKDKQIEISKVSRKSWILFDLITGHDFESENKGTNIALSSTISKNCNYLRASIAIIIDGHGE